MECRRDDRRYPKLSTEMEPENRISHKSLQYRPPRKKGFRKTLPSLERPVHVVAERELYPKLRMEEEKEEEYISKNVISSSVPI